MPSGSSTRIATKIRDTQLYAPMSVTSSTNCLSPSACLSSSISSRGALTCTTRRGWGGSRTCVLLLRVCVCVCACVRVCVDVFVCHYGDRVVNSHADCDVGSNNGNITMLTAMVVTMSAVACKTTSHPLARERTCMVSCRVSDRASNSTRVKVCGYFSWKSLRNICLSALSFCSLPPSAK